MGNDVNTFEFKAEAKQLLDLMIHSVYSNREIFLRELISNASDALDKLRFEALTKDELRKYTNDLHIRIEPDPEKKTLSVHDNGIGMTRDEVIQFIGTIAKSGTQEYLKMLKDSQKKEFNAELIGQFGVGFYSSFMVADKVTLITRHVLEEKAWKWESAGDGKYSIEETSRETPGTTVTLHLKDIDEENPPDFTSEWEIKGIVKKYSDFVSYPIRMKTSRMETPRDEQGKPKAGEKPQPVVEDEVLNSMKAIWTKSEKEVTESEYKDFYKHISHDWNDPIKWFQYRAEGTTGEFKALIYFPSKPTPEFFFGETKKGIHLYIKRVFIMNDCKELIPEYLRFVRGVVDSEDLSLNISREILQQNRQIQNIRQALSRKILDVLKSMKNDDRKKYIEFWKEFGATIKEGLFKEPADADKIFDCALFQTTHSSIEPTTIEEYIARMKPGQENIYYISGDSRQTILSSPHLEAFKEKGYEVLLFTDPVDEVWVQFCREAKGKKLQAVSKGKVELGSEEERKKAEETRKEKESTFKSLLEAIKTKLDDKVKEVRLSSRLTSSPACLVGEVNEMSFHMEALLKASGKETPMVKRVLELNPTHPIIEKLQSIFKKDKNDPRIGDFADLLFGQALLAEGAPLPDPGSFSKKLTELMIKVL